MPKVLAVIVEDEKLVARLYEKALTIQGFEVKLAHNGTDGVALIKEAKLDVVLMDIMMPGLNGIQALESVKADPATKNIPVIMLTNLSGQDDAELALSKGAAEYWVKKDIDPAECGDKIKKVLEKVKKAE